MKKRLSLTILLCISLFSGLVFGENYRPQISIGLTKAIISGAPVVVVPDVEECECNGKGYIVHGDGHRTPCPCYVEGTNKLCECKKTGEDPKKCGCQSSDEWVECECNKGCDCVDCKKHKVEKSEDGDPQFLIYHFGADWCGPCNSMISNVWNNKEIKDKISENDFKLYIFDADNPSHKKFFNYYRIRAYPTIIIVNKNDLNNPIFRVNSTVSKTGIMNIIDKE